MIGDAVFEKKAGWQGATREMDAECPLREFAMFDRLPVEIEPGQMLAEPVSSIRGFTIFPRGGEQLPPSIRQRGGSTTNAECN